MGRWTQYDEDDYRLPEGMKRVGYDADTQRYTFKDKDGSLWEGPEGQEFGEMRRISDAPGDSNDLESSAANKDTLPNREDGAAQTARRDSYRTLLPFLLIVMVFLLLVLRLYSPALLKPQHPTCPEHTRPYHVKAGDTCWKISKEYGTSVEKLKNANGGVECSKLLPEQRLCVPVKD